MGTGVLASTVSQLPHHSFRTLGLVLFYTNVALLSLLIIFQMLQLCIHPGVVTQSKDLVYYGAVPLAMSTVVWDGPLGYVLWVVAVAMAWMAMLMFVYLASRQFDFTVSWLFLIAPLAACASAGSTIQDYPTVTMSYILLGAGAPLTFIILVLHVQTLVAHPQAYNPQLNIMPLGPVGQIGVAAISLGHNKQSEERAQLGLMVWGCCCFWAIHGFCSITSIMLQGGKRKWPGWALVFPIGVFTTLTIELGEVLGEDFFRFTGIGLVAVLFCLWLVNIGCAMADAWTGAISSFPS
ncbi:voltage-dependent anion channel [Coemansia spiralis]|nr:voltage-dependent anion channel [Coemansia spiralis]